ncbi:MAG TPA: SDR family NAD(P)-dependent oxidoreductase [Terriglobales bacterium]|nr:SDR family NAD(P)-dependent oxidoreductase [Terriglobales bacterium]
MYVVTGATGNTGSVVAKRLLAAGKKVRAIGRSKERLETLSSSGAQPAVADVTDREAVTEAFAGAEAVYVMVPPNMGSNQFRKYQDQVTEAAAAGIERNQVKYVVALSSFGADKAAGTGPIVGLHYMEERLTRITGLNCLFLRAGYFMENTLGQAAAIKQFGVTAGPLKPELKLPMIATRDIGNFAADALLQLDFLVSPSALIIGNSLI